MWLVLATFMIIPSIILAVDNNIDGNLKMLYYVVVAAVGIALVYMLGY